MTGRRLLGTLALGACGVLLSLATAELAARVLFRVRCTDRLSGFQVRSRSWGWGNRQGATGWQQRCLNGAPEWRTWLRIDDRGLRGDGVRHARAGGFRVLVLGDSYVHGAQVDDETLFTTQLQHRLEALGVPRPVEVLNAGVNGWGTDNALLYWQHEGWRYEPDLVLLAFDLSNDVFENDRRMVGMSPFWADKPYFTLVDGRLERRGYPLRAESWTLGAARATVGALVRHSALASLASQVPAVARLLVLPPPPQPADGVVANPLEILLRNYPPHWREAWAITRGLLLRLRQSIEARGARFAVVVVNSREEVSPQRLQVARGFYPSLRTADCDPDKPNRVLTQFLARRGIPTIEMLEPFRTAFGKDGTPGFFSWDVHWAPAGHTLAARLIAERLQRLGLLPLRAAPAAS